MKIFVIVKVEQINMGRTSRRRKRAKENHPAFVKLDYSTEFLQLFKWMGKFNLKTKNLSCRVELMLDVLTQVLFGIDS